MRRRTPRIWLGIGAFALAAGATDGKLVAPDVPGKLFAPAWAAGGEGGEGGEQGGERGGHAAAIESDDGIVAQLLLMRGHLLAATGLVAKGEVEQAKPHLTHPLEELFAPVHEPLEERHREREEALEMALAGAHTAAEDDAATMREAAEAALAAIDDTVAAVAAGRLSDPAFAAAVLGVLLESVAEEYDESIEDGRFVNVEEYQDAWGFLQVAREIWSKVAADGGHAEAVAAVAAKLDELEAAFPDVLPPAAPVADAGRVRASVSAIEFHLSALRG